MRPPGRKAGQRSKKTAGRGWLGRMSCLPSHPRGLVGSGEAKECPGVSPAGRVSRSGCHRAPQPDCPQPLHSAASAHLRSRPPSLPRWDPPSWKLKCWPRMSSDPGPAHFWAVQVYTALLPGPYTSVSAQEAGCPPVPSGLALPNTHSGSSPGPAGLWLAGARWTAKGQSLPVSPFWVQTLGGLCPELSQWPAFPAATSSRPPDQGERAAGVRISASNQRPIFQNKHQTRGPTKDF